MSVPSATARNSWDYIIVGGGTAGCVLAARLTEQPDVSVLLLEAGGEYPFVLSVPLAGMRQMTHFSWKYFTSQQAGLGGRRISFPFGKVLGGSSSINAMMYWRGSPSRYDRWRELGNASWGFADLLPYFCKSENQQRGPSRYHGVGGPIDVSDARHQAPFSLAFVEACLQTGLPAAKDFNGDGAEGAGFFQVTQRRGRRASAAGAYLKPARKRTGLAVETGVRDCRLVLEGAQATGVAFVDRSGERHSVRATREVILSAGTLNSPKILMLSGIGPADHLQSLGIAAKVDLPGVGQNLQDHVRVPVLYESGRRSPGDVAYWVPAVLDYMFRKKGVLTSNCCESGALVRSNPQAEAPDLQLVTHFQTALYPETVDLQVCLLDTRSRGSVTLASADPQAAPVIDPRYLAEASDIRLALDGVRLARTIAKAPALQKFPLGAEVLPGLDLDSDAALEKYVRSTAETCYHPVGTCKMGSDALAVVDDQLRVHGVSGLRVVDASMMPELPNGNTCAPTLMIAEKASDLIKRA